MKRSWLLTPSVKSGLHFASTVLRETIPEERKKCAWPYIDDKIFKHLPMSCSSLSVLRNLSECIQMNLSTVLKSNREVPNPGQSGEVPRSTIPTGRPTCLGLRNSAQRSFLFALFLSREIGRNERGRLVTFISTPHRR